MTHSTRCEARKMAVKLGLRRRYQRGWAPVAAANHNHTVAVLATEHGLPCLWYCPCGCGEVWGPEPPKPRKVA
jgi:hypothetical protein